MPFITRFKAIYFYMINLSLKYQNDVREDERGNKIKKRR